MSSGPTLTGETCIEVTKHGYINLQIEREDWCTYKGVCNIDRVVFREDICFHCIYRKKFNIPKMLNERIKSMKK